MRVASTHRYLNILIEGEYDIIHPYLCAAQVLIALAPLQQEQGDMSGADSMLKSSFTLSKNLQDLHSQVLKTPKP